MVYPARVQTEELSFRCNICGESNTCPRARITREDPSCRGCGSTVRMRAVMACLSRELFGEVLPLAEFPLRRDIRGVGLSDWEGYAGPLAERLDYTNTYYHREPRLDITDVDDTLAGRHDFVLSSDVFEHVAPPVSRAFAGARRLLKPGGVIVLTVPYAVETSETREHFPDLYQWSVGQEPDGGWVLVNRRRDGGEERFTDLVFHGGAGATLEMRLFSRDSLIAELIDAGFRDVHVAAEPLPEWGVLWPGSWSLPIVARSSASEGPAGGEGSVLGQVFDQYQNLMQIARCVREAERQRGLGRSRVLELTRHPTGLDGYLPGAQIVRLPTHVAEQPVFTADTRLPVADGAFDVCLVTDAYEHLPPETRPHLLSEIVRVTRGLVLLGCPIDNGLVGRLDRVVFDFIWGKYAERFTPLHQHMRYGVESLEDVIVSLRGRGAERVLALPANHVYRWVHQILLFFDLQHRHPAPHVYETVNAIYNERISPFDYREPCYRYLIVMATDPAVNLDALGERLTVPPEPPPSLSEVEGLLIEAYRGAESRSADELRRLSADLGALRTAGDEAVGARDAEIRRLQDVLRETDVQHNAEIARVGAVLHESVSARDGEITRLQGVLQESVAVRDAEVARLQGVLHESVSTRDGEIRRLQLALHDATGLRDREIARLQRALEETVAVRDREIARLQAALADAAGVRDTEIRRLQAALADAVSVRDAEIRRLQHVLGAGGAA